MADGRRWSRVFRVCLLSCLPSVLTEPIIVWNHSARATTEVEPQLTLRGHSAAITRLIHAPSKQLLYSASLDSSIRVWALPPPSHTTYAPYDETRARGELVGHTDAVWDLALVRDESTLISCGAEGVVKVWDVSGPSGGGSLRLTWGWNGLEGGEEPMEDMDAPGATSVEAIKSDLKKVAVAYQNAVVKIFDIESGKALSRLQSDMSYGVFCFKTRSEP
jgi:striatin 1/3/4